MSKAAVMASDGLPPRSKTRGQLLWAAIKKHRLFYMLLIPGLVFFIIFKYVPLYGVIIAFKDVPPFASFAEMLTAPFVGLKHFVNFMSSHFFGQLMRNTLVISGLKLLFSFPAPIIFALLLNEIRQEKFKRTIQTISYLPHFISMVVVCGLLTLLLSTDGGFVNGILMQLGWIKEPIYFLGEPRYFRSILVISSVWQGVGWSAIIYLAALTSIDPQLYEAATMDGAGMLRRMWHITLPGISNIIVIMFILAVGGILDAGFEQVLLLYSPPVYEVGDIIDTYVYRQGIINFQYSFSTAVSLFKSVIAMALILVTNFVAKLMGHDGIW